MSKENISAFFRGVLYFPRKLVILPIKFYRRFLSPLKGTPSCRFTPTCSAYALEAITEWGVIVGLALSFWRVFRCNPFGGCGHDPVPRRKKKKASCDADGGCDTEGCHDPEK